MCWLFEGEAVSRCLLFEPVADNMRMPSASWSVGMCNVVSSPFVGRTGRGMAVTNIEHMRLRMRTKKGIRMKKIREEFLKKGGISRWE